MRALFTLFALLASWLPCPAPIIMRPISAGAPPSGFDTTDLSAWWDTEGDTADDSGNGHDATAINSMGFTTGPFSDANGAWNTIFSGNNKHASVTYDAAFNPAGAFSIVAWVDLSGAHGNTAIMGHGTAAGGNFAFRAYIQGGVNDRVVFSLSNDGLTNEDEISNNGTFPDATGWTHVAITYDGTNTVTYYANGTSVGTDVFSTETGAIHASDAPILIGQADAVNSTAPIARPSFWVRALEPEEVHLLWDGETNDDTPEDVKFADLVNLSL